MGPHRIPLFPSKRRSGPPDPRATDLDHRIAALCTLMSIAQASHPETPINVAEYARVHSVPYQRLNSRWNGRGTRFGRAATHKRLSDQRERALGFFCEQRRVYGRCVEAAFVGRVAERMMRRSAGEGEEVKGLGEKWGKRFLERVKIGDGDEVCVGLVRAIARDWEAVEREEGGRKWSKLKRRAGIEVREVDGGEGDDGVVVRRRKRVRKAGENAKVVGAELVDGGGEATELEIDPLLFEHLPD